MNVRLALWGLAAMLLLQLASFQLQVDAAVVSKEVPTRDTIIPTWTQIAKASATTAKLTKVKTFWSALKAKDVAKYQSYVGTTGQKTAVKNKIKAYYAAAEECLEVTLFFDIERKKSLVLDKLNNVRVCLDKAVVMPKFTITEEITPKPTATIAPAVTAKPAATPAPAVPSTANVDDFFILDDDDATEDYQEEELEPETTPVPPLQPTQADKTPVPVVVVTAVLEPPSVMPIDVDPADKPVHGNDEPIVVVDVPAVFVPPKPIHDADEPSSDPTPTTHVPATETTLGRLLSDDAPATPTEEKTQEPIRVVSLRPDYHFSPSSAVVPPFAVLDFDQDGTANRFDWVTYMQELQGIAHAAIARASHEQGKEFLSDIIEFHYDNLNTCITKLAAEHNAGDLSELDFAVLTLKIEAHCVIKFRYSLFAGPPPFEWIARKSRAVSADTITKWFSRQLMIAKRDMGMDVVGADVSLSPMEHFLACLHDAMESHESSIDRALYTKMADASLACMNK